MQAKEVAWVRASSAGNCAYSITIDGNGKLIQLHLKQDIDGVKRAATSVTVQKAAARMAEIVRHAITFDPNEDIEQTDAGQIAFPEMVAKQRA